MTDQAELFSKSLKSKSRGRWTNSILEETIVKVIRDGLNACRIPNYRVRERIPVCYKCHSFVGQGSECGIPDLLCWIPAGLMPPCPVREAHARAVPLFIEVKRPKGGIESQCQKQFIERANRDGGIAIFARGWDECADQLREAGVKIPAGL
jgi:hypothetical protein